MPRGHRSPSKTARTRRHDELHGIRRLAWDHWPPRLGHDARQDGDLAERAPRGRHQADAKSVEEAGRCPGTSESPGEARTAARRSRPTNTWPGGRVIAESPRTADNRSSAPTAA